MNEKFGESFFDLELFKIVITLASYVNIITVSDTFTLFKLTTNNLITELFFYKLE